MKIVLAGLAFVAPVALLFAYPVAPAPSLSCEGVITIDEQGQEPEIHHDCANWGCAPGCTMENVSVGEETGQTCSCQGLVPSCCHLVLIDDDPVFDIVPVGDCKAQDSECPTGNTCMGRWNEVEDDLYEVTPNCIFQN